MFPPSVREWESWLSLDTIKPALCYDEQCQLPGATHRLWVRWNFHIWKSTSYWEIKKKSFPTHYSGIWFFWTLSNKYFGWACVGKMWSPGAQSARVEGACNKVSSNLTLIRFCPFGGLDSLKSMFMHKGSILSVWLFPLVLYPIEH